MRDANDVPHNQLTRCVIGAFFDVYNALRWGFLEAVYGGALAIEFEDPPAKFVVSPNSPVSQIWVSAHSKSFKLDWDETRKAFVLAGTGQSLAQLIGDAVGQQLGEKVAL